MIRNRGIRQGIQLSRFNILFNLPIPYGRVKFLIPSAEFFQFTRRQFRYRFFDILYTLTHYITSVW